MLNIKNSEPEHNSSRRGRPKGARNKAYRRLPMQNPTLGVRNPSDRLHGLIAKVRLREGMSLRTAEILEQALEHYVEARGYD